MNESTENIDIRALHMSLEEIRKKKEELLKKLKSLRGTEGMIEQSENTD